MVVENCVTSLIEKLLTGCCCGRLLVEKNMNIYPNYLEAEERNWSKQD